jgi:hypothetical protein
VFPGNNAELSDIPVNIVGVSGIIADILAKTADIGLILVIS